MYVYICKICLYICQGLYSLKGSKGTTSIERSMPRSPAARLGLAVELVPKLQLRRCTDFRHRLSKSKGKTMENPYQIQ